MKTNLLEAKEHKRALLAVGYEKDLAVLKNTAHVSGQHQEVRVAEAVSQPGYRSEHPQSPQGFQSLSINGKKSALEREIKAT